ncbi:MAG TPA: hypothetical protein VMZ52_17715 [Bryobacteraceae bacterium]|nr:hypothetical protein [Bryobacteraceae bacterium]
MIQVPTRIQVVIVSALLLFLVANRGAYKGYFQDDDLDNLSWTWQISGVDFVQGLATPVFSRNNFRPVGHLFFHAVEPLAGLRFLPYVAGLQGLHLLNAALLLWVARGFGFRVIPSAVAAVFFLFHPATFDAYWRPMYIFDVACATFCLACIVAYTHRKWVLSFAFFWLAYKAKELAVMLPVVIALYEMWFGEKRWRRLIPFFAVSLCFGVQALIANRQTHDAYTIELTGSAIFATIRYYSSLILLHPLSLLLILPAAFLVRDRRLYFGLLGTLALLLPLLALPNRQFSVYLYVPLLFLALALAAVLEKCPPGVAIVFLLCWIPATYLRLRHYRAATLETAQQNRVYVGTLEAFVKSSPGTTAFVYDGAPAALNPWGISGAVRYLTRNPSSRVASLNSPEGKGMLRETSFAVLGWDSTRRRLDITRRDPSAPYKSYIDIQKDIPIWQFGEGWYERENAYRWTKPVAVATLLRPANAAQFEISVNVSPIQLQAAGSLSVEVMLDGNSIGAHQFTKPGWQKIQFRLLPSPEALVAVELRSSPAFQPSDDSRSLGAAIGGFGFLP